MELLPIIYTTLQIFVAIAIVTIIGSYISFKIRKKKGLLENEESTDILETPDFIKQRSQSKPNETNSNSVKEEKYREEKKSNQSGKNNHRRVNEKRSSRDKKREHERYLEEKRLAEERRLREEKEKIRSKERIQVLNSLDNSRPNKSTKSTSEFSKPIVNQKYKTLGDDIMKNYAENEEDSFKPLNTKNKKTN